MDSETTYHPTGICPGCGCGLAHGITICVPCKVKQRATEEATRQGQEKQTAQLAKAIGDTEQAFPEVIRETDLTRLDERLRSVVEGYDPTRRESWLLFGSTRVGKTRTAFCLAREYARKMGKPAHFYTMRKFEATIDQSFRDKRHGEVLQRIIDHPFLVLDDFGKERLTERLAVDIFAIVDERTSERRPTIITTNLTGDALEAKFAAIEPNLAAALVARLREFFRKASAF